MATISSHDTPSMNLTYMERNEDVYGTKSSLNGMYRGVVVDNRDPIQMGRCRVRCYSLHGDEQVTPDDQIPFANYITPEAGSDSGSFSPPDVGSKVWILFERGDPQLPLYMGGWISQLSAGETTPESGTATKVKGAANDLKQGATDSKANVTAMDSTGAGAVAVADKAPVAVNKVDASTRELIDAVDNLVVSTPPTATSIADIPAPAITKFNNAAKAAGNSAGYCTDVSSEGKAVADSAVADAGACATAVQTTTALKTSTLAKLAPVTSAGATSYNTAEKSSIKGAEDLSLQAEELRLSAISNYDHSINMQNYTGAMQSNLDSLTSESNSVAANAAGIDSLLNTSWTYEDFSLSLYSYNSSNRQSLQRVNNDIRPAVIDTAATIKETNKNLPKINAAADLNREGIKATSDSIKGKVAKRMGKKEDDPSSWPVRKQDFNDETWDVEPGLESPVESQVMSANVPSLKVIKKSAKGHTIMYDDMDSKESLHIIDRAGNTIYMDCAVPSELNAGNKNKRKSNSALSDDAMLQSKMRDAGSKVGIRDQAQSKVELDSRIGSEKVVLIANDGKRTGVDNGQNRQVIQLSSCGNVITIESVQGGKSKARIDVDSVSGSVTITTELSTNIRAKYISIKADHINIDGKCNINGDLTINGRVTGGGIK